MSDSDDEVRSVYIWVCEGTWRASVDAALSLAPAGSRFTLLHVTPTDVPDAAHGAYAGLLGRGHRAGDDPGTRLEKMAATSAGDLLEAAARRLDAGANGGKFKIDPNGPWWQPRRRRICWSWRGTGTGPGWARRAWARSPGSSWIMRPAPSCWSGPSPRPTWPPFPRRRITLRRHHITLPRRTAELRNPDTRRDYL